MARRTRTGRRHRKIRRTKTQRRQRGGGLKEEAIDVLKEHNIRNLETFLRTLIAENPRRPTYKKEGGEEYEFWYTRDIGRTYNVMAKYASAGDDKGVSIYIAYDY